MSGDIRLPDRRECTRCGRRERWDDDVQNWRVGEESGEVFCVHAWDITGEFQPVEK